MAHSFTTTPPILNLIKGGCSARRQLRNSIRYVSLTFCARCIKYEAGDIVLGGGYLHNWSADFDSICGRLLGLTPAFQWYKVRLCHIKTHEFAVFCRGCIRSQAGNILLHGGLLHNCYIEFHALYGKMLVLPPAFQRYKVCLCRIETHAFAVYYYRCSSYQAGDILHDG